MKRIAAFIVIVVALTSYDQKATAVQESRLDLLIRNGRVVDGTGAPWYRADVAIRDGRIAAIGRLTEARATRTIDAAGLVVAPGFIDMMGQTAAPFLRDHGAALNLLTQGITTINCGEGRSDAPSSEEDSRKFGWRHDARVLRLARKKPAAAEHGADGRRTRNCAPSSSDWKTSAPRRSNWSG